MPKKAKAKQGTVGGNKDIERLKKELLKAQENGDVLEESKVCNVLGEEYSKLGAYESALEYHRHELTLSEASSDLLSVGVACRKVGECLCELGDYEGAVQHQKRHLEVAKQLRNLAEEQRANATLGRTYFVYSQSERERGGGGGGRDRGGGRGVRPLLDQATKHYRAALDVCDELKDVSEHERLSMRSRIYMNLGLLCEDEEDLPAARQNTEKALNMIKELGDKVTLYQCHSVLASLNRKGRKDHHIASALSNWQAALGIARELRDKAREADTLRELALLYLELRNFEESKACLKQVLKLYSSLSVHREEVKTVEKQLKTVRRILCYLVRVEQKGEKEKVLLYDKLGDLCCSMEAYSTGLSFYEKQLGVARKLHLDPRTSLSPIYISLARTCADCTKYSLALHYYDQLLQLWKGNPAEECDTWCGIALVRDSVKESMDSVLMAYKQADRLAEKTADPKRMATVCRSAESYINKLATPPTHYYRQKLSRLLEAHPHLVNQLSEDEDSQEVGGDSEDDYLSSASSEGEEEEEEEEKGVAGGGVAVIPPQRCTRSASAVSRGKSQIEKRNKMGETLLHQAVIKKDEAKAKKLIKQGATVHTRDHCGWTPLHEACNHGFLDLARLLLDHGAQVDDPGGENCDLTTPLMDAAMNGHEEVVELLVNHGANLGVVNSEGKTALAMLEDRLISDSPKDLKEELARIRDFLKEEMTQRGLPVAHGGRESRRKRKGRGPSRPKLPALVESEPSSYLSSDSDDSDLEAFSNIRSGTTGVASKGCSVSGVTASTPTRRRDTGSTSSKGVNRPGKGANRPSKGANVKGVLNRGASTIHAMEADIPWRGVDRPRVSADLSKKTRSTPNVHSCSRGAVPTPGMSSINVPPRTSSTNKQAFDPLGRPEIPKKPALMPEDENMDEIDRESGFPIIDQWLVDDTGEGSPSRRGGRGCQRDRSVERESRAMLGLSTTGVNSPSSRTYRPRMKFGVRQSATPPLRSTSQASRDNGGNGDSVSKKRLFEGEALHSGSNRSIIKRPLKSAGSVQQGAYVGSKKSVVTIDESSDEEFVPRRKRRKEASVSRDVTPLLEEENQVPFAQNPPSSFAASPAPSSSSVRNPPSSLFGISTPSSLLGNSTPSSLLGNSAPSSQNLAPSTVKQNPARLCIRVRIEGAAYFIPCPLTIEEGGVCQDTPISWLMAEAAERYFAQWERRPVLRLTKLDGASLYQNDAVAHVLKQDEDLIGVVKEWASESLAERYRKACVAAGQECNTKVQQVLETTTPTSSTLDLSNTGLSLLDFDPLFQTLGPPSCLTVLNLGGNRLRDEAMPRLLAAVGGAGSLVSLDLSGNCITCKGIESLSKDFPQVNIWNSLQTLILSRNTLGGVASGCGLSVLLKKCVKLRELYLDTCALSHELFQPGGKFSKALKCLGELKHFSVGRNSQLGPAGLQGLLRALRDTALTSLNISRCIPASARRSGGKSFSTVLREESGYFTEGDGRYLECLDVSYCGRGDAEALPVLIDCLEHCPGMRELKLSGWDISPEHLEPLCSYVSQSADALSTLDVSGNISLGNEGALQILKACSNRLWVDGTCRMTVSLNACGIESPLCAEFVRLVTLLHDRAPTFRVDLLENSFNESDRSVLSSCSFCT